MERMNARGYERVGTNESVLVERTMNERHGEMEEGENDVGERWK